MPLLHAHEHFLYLFGNLSFDLLLEEFPRRNEKLDSLSDMYTLTFLNLPKYLFLYE